jgi:Acetoacetate decarboxylase (ADC)
MTRYGFRQALGAFFLADSAQLRKLLPAALHVLEARPGHAVLAVTAFDFVESEVGPYGELVLSVLVSPFAGRGNALPHAASFPIALATTSVASRAHAAQRWLLPEYERCFEIDFSRDGAHHKVTVRDQDKLVLTLSVERRHPVPTTRLYQVFSARENRVHRVNLHILGNLDEHQEETGLLELPPHSFTSHVSTTLLDDSPFTEQSMDHGEQQFAELVPHLSEHK